MCHADSSLSNWNRDLFVGGPSMFQRIVHVQVATQGVPETYFRPGVAVPEVNRNSPAAAAGLKRGDIILKVQDVDVPANPAAVPGVVRYIT